MILYDVMLMLIKNLVIFLINFTFKANISLHIINRTSFIFKKTTFDLINLKNHTHKLIKIIIIGFYYRL